MPCSFYAGLNTPELELAGDVHQELEPLFATPLLARLRHFYAADSEFAKNELRQLAMEVQDAGKLAGSPGAKRFLQSLGELVGLAERRGTRILVVRD